MRTFGRCWRCLWSSWESLGISMSLQEPSINASGLRQLRDDWEELPSLRIHWDLPGFHPEFALFVPNPIGSKPKSHQIHHKIPSDANPNPSRSNPKSRRIQLQIPVDAIPNPNGSKSKFHCIQPKIPMDPTPNPIGPNSVFGGGSWSFVPGVVTAARRPPESWGISPEV